MSRIKKFKLGDTVYDVGPNKTSELQNDAGFVGEDSLGVNVTADSSGDIKITGLGRLGFENEWTLIDTVTLEEDVSSWNYVLAKPVKKLKVVIHEHTTTNSGFRVTPFKAATYAANNNPGTYNIIGNTGSLSPAPRRCFLVYEFEFFDDNAILATGTAFKSYMNNDGTVVSGGIDNGMSVYPAFLKIPSTVTDKLFDGFNWWSRTEKAGTEIKIYGIYPDPSMPISAEGVGF